MEGLAAKESRDEIEKLATSPEGARALEAIGAGLFTGVVDAAAGRDFDIDGNVSRTVDGAVDASVDAAYRNRARLRTVAATPTDGIVRSMTAALSEGLREEVLPAVREGIPDGGTVLTQIVADEQLQAAIGSLVYEVSRQAVRGSEEGLDQVRREQEAEGEQGLLFKLGESATTWAVLIPLVLALTIAVGALTIAVVRNRRRRSDAMREADEREQRLTAVLAALAASDKLEPHTRDQVLRASGLQPEPT